MINAEPRIILKESRDAHNKADKIIDSAKSEAHSIIKNALDEADKITENAHIQGVKSAKKEALKHIVMANNHRRNTEQAVLPELVNLCMDTVYLFLSQYQKSHKDWIVLRVKKGLEYLQDQRTVKVLLNPDDLSSQVDKLEMISKTTVLNGSVKLVADNRISKGDCLFESPEGSINATLKDSIDSIRSILLKSKTSFDTEGDIYE